MLLASRARALTLPVGTVERVEITDVHIGGYPDPTGLDVETQLSAAARTPALGDLLDLDDFAPATWADAATIRTPLIDGLPQGEYGLWARITAGDEAIVRYSGIVVLT